MLTARDAALNLIRGYTERDRIRWLQAGTGQSAQGQGEVKSYYAFCGGGWLIPGHKRLVSGYVGVWIRYQDGRFDGVEFPLDDLIAECQRVQQPQQLRLIGF